MKKMKVFGIDIDEELIKPTVVTILCIAIGCSFLNGNNVGFIIVGILVIGIGIMFGYKMIKELKKKLEV